MSKNDQMVVLTPVGASEQEILTMLNLMGGKYESAP